MWQLTVLSLDKLDHTKPFLPDWSIYGGQAKGQTYSVNLHNYPFSDRLQNLVFQYLYEVPANRPTLLEPKREIMDGWEIAKDLREGEAWADMLALEPIDYAATQERVQAVLQRARRAADAEALRARLNVEANHRSC
jgi:hypothetical protein